MFGRIGIGELILILAIALVIFGPAKLPEIGKVIGDAIRNIKKHSENLAQDADAPQAASKTPGTTDSVSKLDKEPVKSVGVKLATDKERVVEAGEIKKV
jgi:sec-independent protein translocase protein TatA